MMDNSSWEYRKGYWKAMLDLKNLLTDSDNYWLKSKKQYKRFIISLLNYLLKDSLAIDLFRLWGGECSIFCSTKKDNLGEVVRIEERQ